MKKGLKKPLGVGVLIFDEVKVIGKVVLNMKNETFLGLAMDEDEMNNLHDIYRSLESREPTPAEYMLQFLWRDLTSSYDIIGPYFSLRSTINHSIVIDTLLETMRAFNNYNFKTICVVCDGASSNMAAIKLLSMDKVGAYGTSGDDTNKHEVKPWFQNPFDPAIDVFFVICPSHQVLHLLSIFSSLLGSRLNTWELGFCVEFTEISQAKKQNTTS